MKTKKRILILGPISNFGGREIEAQLIARSLLPDYKVSLLSTTSIDSHSRALVVDKCFNWTSVEKVIYKSNFLIKISSLLAKLVNNRQEAASRFIGNSFSNQLFNFNALFVKTIEAQISNSDVVVFCGELTSKWLIEVFEIAFQKEIPLIIRTTGSIREVPYDLKVVIDGYSQFLVHSQANYNVFKTNLIENVSLIDQAAVSEKKLLDLELDLNQDSIVYGYLGRFDKEKGIVELLKIVGRLNIKLVVAGNGPLKREVEDLCNRNESIIYIGEIADSNINLFFKQIDVLIIPSIKEAGPLVGVEAMAAGKLIVSTRVGAMPDRLFNVQDQFWFDIDQPQTLIRSIEKIDSLTQEQLLIIKNRIRDHYINNYSYECISNKYKELLSKLLS